jgi:hypothetical protein
VIIESFDDIMGAAGKALFAPADKKQAVVESFKETMKTYIESINTQMQKKNWKFVAGNKLSVADFIVGHLYFTFCDPKFAFGFDKAVFATFP